MRFSDITGTCSMCELNCVDSYSLRDITKNWLKTHIPASKKVVIYNTTSKAAVKKFEELGFKQVMTYYGNSHSYVYTMMLKKSDLNKKTIK